MKYENQLILNGDLESTTNSSPAEGYSENLLVLTINDQIKELQTIIRDKWVPLIFLFRPWVIAYNLILFAGIQPAVILNSMQTG